MGQWPRDGVKRVVASRDAADRRLCYKAGMNVLLRKRMTLQQFLAWEERQELRYEFDGFLPVAMTGGTIAHDRITFNLQKALDARLAGTPCRSYGPEVKIIADTSVRYPDAIVACTPVQPSATVIDNPVIVFEVLSESTANTDIFEKNEEYRATLSIQRYVIIEQTRMAAIMFTRRESDWVSETLAGEAAQLSLPEVGIGLPLTELYAGLDLDRSSRSEAEPA
jgi:Uma2 family endonuclease